MANWKAIATALALHPILAGRAALRFATGDTSAGVALLESIRDVEAREREANKNAAFEAHIKAAIRREGWYAPDSHGLRGLGPTTSPLGRVRGDRDVWGFCNPLVSTTGSDDRCPRRNRSPRRRSGRAFASK